MPLPDVLTPEQMTALQSGNGLPDVMSNEEMMKRKGNNGGLLKTLSQTAANIEQPFVSVAATPVQALAKLTGQPDPFAKGLAAGPSRENIPVAPATPAGFLQKAGQVGQIASTMYTPASIGVKSLALLGGVSGFANSVAEGNTQGRQLVKDTLYGTIMGLGLGIGSHFLSFLGNAERGKTGVVGQVANEMANTPATLVKQYIDSAQGHTENIRISAPDAVAENAMLKRVEVLQNIIKQKGAAVGEAKKAAWSKAVSLTDDTGKVISEGKQAAQSVYDDINQKLQDFTGHQFGRASSAIGEARNQPILFEVPGRNINLTTAETTKLNELHAELDRFVAKPTVGSASDVLTNLDNLLGKAHNSPEIGSDSPVIGALKYARGAINQTIKSADPQLAQAKALFSSLKDLEGEVGIQAGKRLNSASLAMRRVMSGDKSGPVIQMLDELSQITQPFMKKGEDATNLVQHAVVANWAKKMFGNASTDSLLKQHFNSEVSGATSLLGYAKQYTNAAIQKAMTLMSPDVQKYALSVAEGNPQSMNPLVRQIDSIVGSAESVPMIRQISQSMSDLGLTVNNSERAAKQLLKIILIRQLTSPNTAPPQQTPVNLPPTVPQQSQGRTLSMPQAPINASQPVTTGQQYSSQARQLGSFGVNMKQTANGLMPGQ